MELNLVQCREDRPKIDLAATKFQEFERVFCLGRICRNVVDVFEVNEKKTVRVQFNRLGRIASARDEMSDIQLKPNVFRIAVFENEIEIRRTLAENIEVVVVAERDAHIGSSFTQFCAGEAICNHRD
ncbi:MAG: hypothetical protein JWQ49_1303 [Edaphobacter sp.]|nr:hypothetical protein [Edaphobacter sp.]